MPRDPVPSLRELQHTFFDALARAAADDDTLAPSLARVIAARPPLDAAAHVAIYGEMYWARIVAALVEDFPRLHTLVGDDTFRALARPYVARTPSRHPSLRHAGDRFPAFLDGHHGEAAARVPPYAADLARLERARLDVFDAPDAGTLGVDDLRRVAAEAWAELPLRLVPAAMILELGWPAHEAWADETHARNEERAAVDGASAWPRLTARPTALRVWRQGTQVYHAALDSTEHVALAAVVSGATFGEVCAATAAVSGAERAAEKAGALLLRWIDDGLLACP